MQSLLYGLFSESPWNSESVQIPYKIINDSLWAKLTCFPYNNIYIICYHYSCQRGKVPQLCAVRSERVTLTEHTPPVGVSSQWESPVCRTRPCRVLWRGRCSKCKRGTWTMAFNRAVLLTDMCSEIDASWYSSKCHDAGLKQKHRTEKTILSLNVKEIVLHPLITELYYYYCCCYRV